jgi:hypothetical protein
MAIQFAIQLQGLRETNRVVEDAGRSQCSDVHRADRRLRANRESFFGLRKTQAVSPGERDQNHARDSRATEVRESFRMMPIRELSRWWIVLSLLIVCFAPLLGRKRKE